MITYCEDVLSICKQEGSREDKQEEEAVHAREEDGRFEF